MRDLIDREQALKALRGAEAITRAFGYHNVYEAIRRVPSAKPPPETCWGCNCPKMEEPKIAEPKWIPVSERLPEKEGRYLISHQNGKMFIDEWIDGCGWSFFEAITAWIELPKPYKEDE